MITQGKGLEVYVPNMRSFIQQCVQRVSDGPGVGQRAWGLGMKESEKVPVDIPGPRQLTGRAGRGAEQVLPRTGRPGGQGDSGGVSRRQDGGQ